MRWLILAASLVTLAPSALAQAPGETMEVPGERAIQGRLIAPCCWNQTLDSHESPLADQLRAEIRTRLRGGETPAAIEADIVSRYGERVRAVPRDRDTRGNVPLLVGAAMLASVVLLARLAVRWVRRGNAPAEAPSPTPAEARARDDYDARVDDELARLDDA
ncbi:MAG: cytochrome c-type biogenesis protein CcmH [Polyangiales bacterium]